MGPERQRLLLAVASVAAVATLVFLNSLQNGFVLDDPWIIENNEQVHGLEKLGEAVTGPYWPEGLPERGLYRPLTLATYAVDWEIWDGDPFGFHLVNVALHAATSGLVLLLLLGLGATLPAAWVGALLFAVHPVHVEAVANVVGRAEILAALFFLGGCLLYLRSTDGAERRVGWWGALGLGALYFLGLVSKEHVVTLPGVLFLLDLYRQRAWRAGIRRAVQFWRAYAAMAAALVVYFVLRKANIGVFLGTETPPWFFGMSEHVRILTAIRVWPEYLRLLLVPVELVPDYGPPAIVPEGSLLAPLVLIGLATGALVAFLAVRAWGRVPLLAAGIAWFAITVLPVTGLLFPVGVILAERTLYLPSVGLSMVVAGVVPWLWARGISWRPLALVGLVVLGLASFRTWSGNPVWRSGATMRAHLEALHPTSHRVQKFRGLALAERGDTAAALAHLELATRMVPGDFRLRSDYAELLMGRGDYARAAAQLDTALLIIPEAGPARLRQIQAHLSAGHPERAAAAAEEGYRRGGDRAPLHHLRARALARSGRYAEAVAARERSMELSERPPSWAEWANLAGLALLAGDSAVARGALEEARARAPAGAAVPALDGLRDLLERAGPTALPLW